MSTAEDEEPGEEGAPSASTEALVKAAIRDFRDGLFAPGQRLVETDLMKRYGVGRGTVREAIRRLSGEGLVTVTRFRGASIRTLSRHEMVNILSILEVLNGLAAREAARHMSGGGDRARFQAVFSELMSEELRSDFFGAIRKREEFFNLIVECSRNQELDRVLPKLQLLIARVQIPHLMEDAARFEDYRLIGEAILSGDGDFAEFVARRHIRHALEAFRRLPDQQLNGAASSAAG